MKEEQVPSVSVCIKQRKQHVLSRARLQGDLLKQHVSPMSTKGLRACYARLKKCNFVNDCKDVFLHFNGDDPEKNRPIVARPGPCIKAGGDDYGIACLGDKH